MGLYLPDGWVDIDYILNRDDAKYVMVVGARGTGKTYGALKYMLEHDENFILLRRTAKEVSAIKTNDLNPYAPINADTGSDIRIWRLNQDMAQVADTVYNAKGKALPGDKKGIVVALSTFATIRSIASQDTKYIVYDEFIPETHVRQIKDEASAFFNFYESVNRNRELMGKPAVKALCMANSNQIANPYFISLQIVQKVADMKKKGKNYSYFPKLGISVYDLSDSPISKAKKDTFLYQLTEGSDFYDMAVGNAYNDVTAVNIKPQPLNQYSPVIKVGELCVYRAKNANNKYPYYVTPHVSGSPSVYGSTEKELTRFRRTYPMFRVYEISNMFCYENEVSQVLFGKYLGIVD